MDAIRWDGQALELLDQRALPTEERWLRLTHVDEVASAIRDMVVRGAPAIGITAAYGLVLADRGGVDRPTASERLLAARPTAVNLRWALERMADVGDAEAEAKAIHAEDIELNRAIGAHGAPLLDGKVITICNTGSLATGGHGTALGMVRSALEAGRNVHLYALETRPYLQGRPADRVRVQEGRHPLHAGHGLDGRSAAAARRHPRLRRGLRPGGRQR